MIPHPRDTRAPGAAHQRGSAMLEFTVVGPILTLLGLAILQYGLLFFSRNQINHASFMAARAGAMAHAQLGDVRQAYLRAMVPLYGGGTDSAQLAMAKAKATADLNGNLRIELLNPTRESFDDWNAPHLEKKYGARAIPNAGQAFRDASVGSSSGQSVQDANLLKIRVTHGYELKIPLVRGIYQLYLGWLDDGSDPFHTELIARGRLPVVAQATLHMHSDPIESDATASLAGSGNAGAPQDPGTPGAPDPAESPDCETVGCTTVESGGLGGGGDGNDGGGSGEDKGGAGDGQDNGGGSGKDKEGGGDGDGDGDGKDKGGGGDGKDGGCTGADCPNCRAQP